MNKFFICILFCLCINGYAFSQQSLSISGTVLDQKNLPIPNVTVSLDQDKKVTSTNENGQFSITGLQPDQNYKISFRYAGFATQEIVYELKGVSLTGIQVILKEETMSLSDVVVTGVTNPRSKLNSSVSVSTLKANDMQSTGARTTAELFRSIPGIKAEASGGDGNTNITVRGIPISAGGSKYVQLQEDGLPVLQFGNIAFATADQFLRADQTVSRIEAIRGGSASTLASNSPAGIINFISKTGDIEGGALSMSAGVNYGNFRTDFQYGAKVSDGLNFSVGGFYRYGEGPRTAGYAANNGGQFKANLTKRFDNGYIRLYFKYLNDKTAPYFPMPVQVTGSNQNPSFSSLPGFDAKYGALQSPYLLQNLGTGTNGEIRSSDLTEGIHPVSTSFGAELKFDLGNQWMLEERGRFALNNGSFRGAFPASVNTAANTLASVASATGLSLTGARLTDAVTGSAYNGSNAMILHIFDVTLNNFNNFTNDIKLKKNIEGADFAVGLYQSLQNVGMSWNWTSYLSDVNGNGLHPLNIVDASGTALTSKGQFAYGTPVWGNLARNYNVQYQTVAPYASFSYNPTAALTIDASARLDLGKARGNYTGGALSARDMNGNGIIEPIENKVESISYTASKPVNYNYNYMSYSAGLNYLLDPTKAVFARYSKGATAEADRLLFTNGIFANGDAKAVTSKVDQAELGFKGNFRNFGFFVTAFYANINEAAGFEATTQTIIENHYRSLGTELEAALQVNPSFNIKGSLTYTHARLTDGANKGNQPRRQAPLIYTLYPTYKLNKFNVGFTLIGTTGSYAQDINELKLPGYVLLNPFVGYNFGNGFSASINVNNALNSFGFTEAEEGSITANTTSIIRARSVTGRTWSATLNYNF